MTDEMKKIGEMGIDIAMLPVGNKGYTMDFEDAAKATAIIQPAIMIPMHDWGNDLEPFVNLAKRDAPKVKIEILKERPLTI